MADIAVDLQGALRNRLRGYAPLTAIIGTRVFDRVEPGAQFPYVTIFDVQLIEDGTDCRDGDEVNFDIHVWSQDSATRVGSIEAKTIAGHVRKALHQYELPLGADHALVDLFFTDARFLRDPKEQTTHGVVTFRAFTETP